MHASNSTRGGRALLAFGIHGQGVAMLSGVLRSSRPVQVNIAIMRTFVRIRELLATHEELAARSNRSKKSYDSRFQAVFAAIRQMLDTPVPTRRGIGFHAPWQPLPAPTDPSQRRLK